jgi:ribonuclease Z
MFDLGDVSALSPKDILKISHIFITHTHIDHFIGLDTLIRIFLGRNKTLHLFGPPRFLEQLEGKLSGYTWNLVSNYINNFKIIAHEVHPDTIFTKTYACRDRFVSKGESKTRPFSGTILKEPALSVKGTLLDHQIACLGLSLKENFYVNIKKAALKEMGLPIGPWLNRFKNAVYKGVDPQTDFIITWKKHGKIIRERRLSMGYLMERITKISAGQKITYIADALGSDENCARIIELADGSDILFIEAGFMDNDKEMAKKKYHLTAKQAGALARKASAKQFKLFHFSPRYQGRASELEREALTAFSM